MQIFFSVAYLGFMLGTILEIRKVAGTWSHVFDCLKAAALFSLLVFLLFFGKNNTDLAGIFQLWPIAFSFSLMGVFVTKHRKDMVVQLGEGITLLHSMAIFYMILQYFLDPELRLSLSWLIVFAIPLLFSIYHVFSYRETSGRTRLALSVWSSFVMLFFGLLYAKNVFIFNHTISKNADYGSLDASILFFEFFLFGAAGPYILQNLYLLIGYIPDRNELFLDEYHQRVRNLNQTHIERYSTEQVTRVHGSLVFVLVLAVFALNFQFKLVTPLTAVWFCLIVLPMGMKTLLRKV